MDIEAAKQAGEIAAKIEERQPVAKQLQLYHDGGWVITGLRVKSQDGSQETMQPITPLDSEASAKALAFAIGIYQQQIADMQGKLDAL